VEKINTFLAERLWLQIALSVVCATAAILLISPGESPVAVLLRVAGSSIGGVLVLVLLRRREKRAAGGSATGLVALDKKLRDGEAPTEPAERQAMRDLVAQRLHRIRHHTAATAVLAFLVVTLVLLTAATSGLRQTVGYALLGVAGLGWLVIEGRRQRRRLWHMRDALGVAPDASAEVPDRG
jgi:Flp pilus assembly protein TadB